MKTLQNILEQQKKNTAKLEEILAENEKGKLALNLDEKDEMDVKEGMKDSEEEEEGEEEVQGIISRMSSSLLSMLSLKKSPAKEPRSRWGPAKFVR